MEITLEQIDAIRQRTGTGYREAREALEAAGGNLVEALVLLERQEGFRPDDAGPSPAESPPQGEPRQQDKKKGNGKGSMMMQNRIVSGMMGFSKKSKIRVTLPGERKVEIPAILGVAGALMAPKVAALSGMALLMAKSSITMDYAGTRKQEEPEEGS